MKYQSGDILIRWPEGHNESHRSIKDMDFCFNQNVQVGLYINSGECVTVTNRVVRIKMEQFARNQEVTALRYNKDHDLPERVAQWAQRQAERTNISYDLFQTVRSGRLPYEFQDTAYCSQFALCGYAQEGINLIPEKNLIDIREQEYRKSLENFLKYYILSTQHECNAKSDIKMTTLPTGSPDWRKNLRDIVDSKYPLWCVLPLQFFGSSYLQIVQISNEGQKRSEVVATEGGEYVGSQAGFYFK